MEEKTEIQKTEQLPAEKPAETPKKKKLSKKKIALIVAAALILVPLGSCVYGTPVSYTHLDVYKRQGLP